MGTKIFIWDWLLHDNIVLVRSKNVNDKIEKDL
jgi:hypothetical protein